MKILFLLRLWPVYGGGESVTRTLANEFVKRGYEIHVAYFKHTPDNIKSDVDSRVIEHLIKNVDCNQYTDNFIEDKDNVSDNLCSIINEYNINIVINQWHPYSYIRNIKQKTQAKVIWCHHTIFIQPFEKPHNLIKWIKYSLFPRHYKQRNINEALRKVEASIPYIDKFVFLSKVYVDQYFKFSKSAYGDYITSIANPIRLNRYSTNEEKENIVLVVGRMHEETKKYSNVLKVWRLIEKNSKIIDSWRIMFIGDGESLDYYKELAAQYKLKHISFEGYQDPTLYYKKAKLFLMTSRIEGFPMAILEAQKNGVVPIVMNSFPAAQDLIQNNVNGILTTKDDIKEMSNAVLDLMSNEEKRIRLLKNGLETCKEFSVEKIINQWEHLFITILKK